MMKFFEEPIIKLVKLNVEDVITTSGGLLPGDENAGAEDEF